MTAETIVGVISDTHGLLRPEAVAVLRGSDLIIHAGDVGDPAILSELGKIAPVHAVRGNVDTEPWAESLPETEVVEIGEVVIYVLHNRNQLDLKPAASGFAAVISGHSHQPAQETIGGFFISILGVQGPGDSDCRSRSANCGCSEKRSRQSSSRSRREQLCLAVLRWKSRAGDGASKPAEVVMKSDPVCGMQVDEKNAISSQKGGETQYFCSTDCKNKYEQNPERYKKTA